MTTEIEIQHFRQRDEATNAWTVLPAGATSCMYLLYLANGWKRVIDVKPIDGENMVLHWQRVVDFARKVIVVKEGKSCGPHPSRYIVREIPIFESATWTGVIFGE